LDHTFPERDTCPWHVQAQTPGFNQEFTGFCGHAPNNTQADPNQGDQMMKKRVLL
jgi:hypothetical protein